MWAWCYLACFVHSTRWTGIQLSERVSIVDNRESCRRADSWGAGSPITCKQWSTFGSKNTCDSTQSSILWTTHSFRSCVVGTKTVSTLNLRSGTFWQRRADKAGTRHVSSGKGVLTPFVRVDVSNRVCKNSGALTEPPAPGKLEKHMSNEKGGKGVEKCKKAGSWMSSMSSIQMPEIYIYF